MGVGGFGEGRGARGEGGLGEEGSVDGETATGRGRGRGGGGRVVALGSCCVGLRWAGLGCIGLR